MSKILAFSGSSRKESLNQRLVQLAARGAREAGAEVTVVNLADYPMPLFNQDLEKEQGLPAKVREFKALMVQHQGLLIASPEYNSAISPLLKNTLDWASRAESKDEGPLAAYQGKTAAIMAASPGALGGLRGLVFLRMLLGNLGVALLPAQQAIPRAFEAFAEDGSLVDEKKNDAILELGRSLARMTLQLHPR